MEENSEKVKRVLNSSSTVGQANKFRLVLGYKIRENHFLGVA
jgi:hypothetical protein